MRDRLVTAAGALLALGGVLVFVLSDYAPSPTRPTSVESGPNGYRALADWFADGGVAVFSYRERWHGLGDEFGTGNLFITTLPHKARLRMGEAEALRAWVASGNTLLVLAALNDTPDWLGVGVNADAFLTDVEMLTGMTFETVTVDGKDITMGSIASETPVTLLPSGEHPLLASIDALEAVTDSLTNVWRSTSTDARPLAVAVTEESETAAIWQLRHGQGEIFLVGVGSLLTNRAIGRADNAVFVANLLRRHMRSGETAIFDDMHQGLTALYDPEALFRDPRLYTSLLFVLALWFVYMVGTWNRLAPVRDTHPQPGQQDFVRAVGGFLARKLHPVDAGRMLLAAWFASLEHRRVSFDELPWRRLDDNPAMDKTVVAELKADHERLRGGRPVDLNGLQNRLRQLMAAGRTP